jgi:UDP-glucose 4-epimerase
MKILVTGSAGFIGSHLCDRLLEMGYSVVGLDDLSSGHNLNPEVEFFKGSTCKLPSIFKQIELCFHLAGNTNVPLSVKDPLFDFKTLQGSLNVIDACSKQNIPLVYISSSFIYGDSHNTKEDAPFRLTAPYGIVKKTTEDYIRFYERNYDLYATIVRPATVYGPRQVGGAMADYIRKLKAGEQAVIYGSKTRDYLYISDFIDALILVALKRDTFNVGTGKETSLFSLYLDIGYMLNKDAYPISEKERPGEIKRQSLNCNKLRNLGWKPKINLTEGLKLCLKELQK